MNMSKILGMIGTYAARNVARYEPDPDVRFFIDTSQVYDADLPFETAVYHPDYHNGKGVIVEAYATREEAAAGHSRWVATMTTEPLPAALTDIGAGSYGKMLGRREFVRGKVDDDD